MKAEKPKYILHVIGSGSTKYGGLERFIISLAKELSHQNIKLIAVYNSLPKSELFLKDLKKNDITIYVSNALKPLSFFVTFLIIFIKYKPVVVHSHFQPLFPNLFGWFFGCKHRFYSVLLMLLDKHLKEAKNREQISLKKLFYNSIINFTTTRFLAVSLAVKKQYINIFPKTKNKFSVLYTGGEANTCNKQLSRIKLGFSKELVYICSISFASKIKGIDVLINAAGILQNDFMCDNFKLCLIGLDKELPLSKELISSIEILGIKEKVIWFGIIENLTEVITAMDIYIQPSRTEAFSYAIIEAGMAGLPCVASNVGGNSELIIHKETGFLFKSEDSLQLAEHLIALIKNPSLRNYMGDKSKLFISENFTSAKQITNLKNIYFEALRHTL